MPISDRFSPPCGQRTLHVVVWAMLAICIKGVSPLLAISACPPSPNSVCDCRNTSSGYIVECNNRNPTLYVVPEAIPEQVEVLNLASNGISLIDKNAFFKLEKVRTIFLQQNSISFIEAGTFNNLYSLELIVLEGNRLSHIQDTMFQHLPSINAIDLNNNPIVRVDKRSFLTLPATHSTSRVTIRINSNSINCNCEIRAIRDWKKNSLNGSLAAIHFDGFPCSNAQGTSLDNMQDSDFPTCTSSQLSMFVPNQRCGSCRSDVTQHSCDARDVSSCGAPEPMCQSEVQVVNGKLSIYKSCGSFSDCLLRERSNYRLCKLSNPNLQCTFCCVGNKCNYGDMGGRTKSFRVYIAVSLSLNFQSYMLQPSNSRYLQDADIYEQKFSEMFQGAEGGYDVEFLSFRNESGYTYVSALVYTTHLNTHTLRSVIQLMKERLNISAQTGFLRQRGVTYIYVGTELSTAKACRQEVTTTAAGPITWNEVPVSTTANIACPSGTRGYAYRKCVLGSNGAAVWEAPHVNCDPATDSQTTQKLTELTNTDINANTVNSVLDQLDKLTQAGSTLTADDVILAMDTIDRALAQESTFGNIPALTSTVNALSNLVDADDDVLKTANDKSRAAERLLAAADKVSEKGQLTGGRLMLSAANLAVAAQAVDANNFQGLTLSASAGDDGVFQSNEVAVQPRVNAPVDQVSSLVLPPSLMESAPGSRVAMTVHLHDKAFEATKRTGGQSVSDGEDSRGRYSRQINSHVMAASVVGHSAVDLKDPVTFTLVHDNSNSTNPSCVFWDEADLQWSSRGCRMVDSPTNQNATTCQCDHLTNFALLMDVYGEGSSLSSTDSKILSIISYIGCGVSLLALLLTLITYILFKKLRRDNPSKILVNLCLALALSNLIFVAGMQPYALENDIGCKVVGALLHFSLLSSLCWMAVEAFYMYLALVLVFKTYFTNFILKCSLVGWGVPLVIVGVTLGVNDTDNYGALDTGVCWLRGMWFYGAFVAPVCLILLINFMAFGLVLRQILGLSARKLNKSDSFTVAQQLRGATGVAILLGLTWAFAIFAIDQASVVFYYLFAIFNSLQGLWIFLFYCVLKKEARNAWIRTLPCCHALDDKSGVISSSRAAYSGTATTLHGAHRSTTDTSTGRTSSSAVAGSKSFSDAAYEMPYDNSRGPVKTGNGTDKTYANVDSSDVYINLRQSNLGDVEKDGAKPRSPPPQPSHSPPAVSTVQNTVTAYRSEGKVTIVSTSPAPSATQSPQPPRPIDFRSGHTAVDDNPQPKPTSALAPQQSGSPYRKEDPRASPRPLHFKLGHAHSLEPSDKHEEESQDGQSSPAPQPGQDDSGNQSVAAMIKKLNNPRI